MMPLRCRHAALVLGTGLFLAACSSRDAPPRPVAGPAPSSTAEQVYVVVQRGQTLDALAESFGIAKSEVIAANGLKPPYTLKPGTVLKVPVAPPTAQSEVPSPPKPAASPATTLRRPVQPAAAAASARPVRPKPTAKPKPVSKSKPPPPRVIPLD